MFIRNCTSVSCRTPIRHPEIGIIKNPILIIGILNLQCPVVCRFIGPTAGFQAPLCVSRTCLPRYTSSSSRSYSGIRHPEMRISCVLDSGYFSPCSKFRNDRNFYKMKTANQGLIPDSPSHLLAEAIWY